MTILVWNVRDLNLKERRRDVKNHIHTLSPSIVGLVETKVRPTKAYRVNKAIPHGWQFVNKYECSNKGRIWLCRNASIWLCIVLSVSLQQITIQATNKRGLAIIMSGVYGENWISQREALRDDLKLINHSHGQKPWTILGDFNTARFINEKLGGNRLTLNLRALMNLLMIVIYLTLEALEIIGLGTTTPRVRAEYW